MVFFSLKINSLSGVAEESARWQRVCDEKRRRALEGILRSHEAAIVAAVRNEEGVGDGSWRAVEKSREERSGHRGGWEASMSVAPS